MKQKYFIDFHKGMTFVFVLCIMAYFKTWQNTTLWVYLALHGTYGLMWVMKSNIFPDKNWEEEKPLWFNLLLSAGLLLYWVAPVIIAAWNIEAPGWYLACAVSMFTFGVFFHYVADMQKFVELKRNPGQLITDGMMALSRNINFFGEFLIYFALVMLSMQWWWMLAFVIGAAIIWGLYINRKEKSLARYAEFREYKRKTKLFFPFLF